ncbi:MAG: c-type cytochrome domain-containing protein [Kiloniellaceae bacterium]
MNIQGRLSAWLSTVALAALLAAPLAAMTSTNAAAQDVVSYKEDVFPIIELRCLECHQPGGSGYEASGLDLRTYEGLMKGTKYGSIVTPGSAFDSNLIAVIDRRTDAKIWMPHNRKRLSKCERLMFRFWVSQGAKNN